MRIAGVELGGTKCVCVLSQDGATIVEARRIDTTDPETTMAAIEQALDQWRGFDAIGIASFGPIGIDTKAASYGHIPATTKQGWANTDVAGRLQRPICRTCCIATMRPCSVTCPIPALRSIRTS